MSYFKLLNVNDLNVSLRELIISVAQERVREREIERGAIDYSLFCGFCLDGLPLPPSAYDKLRLFIVALPGTSI